MRAMTGALALYLAGIALAFGLPLALPRGTAAIGLALATIGAHKAARRP